MTDDNAFIRIDHVSKDFGDFRAVDRVAVDIARGEFFSLLGASGCGKTTLLRMLAGFESPSEGEIYIDGQAMSEVPPHHRPTNMVFQSYAIFPHLDVRSNVAYGLRKEKLSRGEVDRKVHDALSMVKLEGYENRKSTELSGGQRQRVALARALIKRPKVLLLDEPLGALDKKLRDAMQLELRALQQSLGITFVFVTHDQEEALTMSDRIAVMSGGVVLQIASPRELYERPSKVEVASFIGQMNFFPGEISGEEGGAAVIKADRIGTVKCRLGEELSRGNKSVVVAMRPEKLHVAAEQNGRDYAVEGEIRNAAYLGDRSHYYVHVPGSEEPIAVSAQNADNALSDRLQRESSVWVTWSEDAMVVLPKDET